MKTSMLLVLRLSAGLAIALALSQPARSQYAWREHRVSQVNSRFGFRTATLADFTGDGVREYAISAYAYDHSGINNAGRLEIYCGSSGRRLNYRNWGCSCQFGYAICNIGDLNAMAVKNSSSPPERTHRPRGGFTSWTAARR